MTIKGKTWSRGTNSCLPFGVNVNLNLSNKRQKYTTKADQSNSEWSTLTLSQHP